MALLSTHARRYSRANHCNTLVIVLLLICSIPSLDAQIPATGSEFRAVFQKGAVFSHNHSEESGYGGQTAATSLIALREIGADWVSIVPVGYSFNIRHPAIFGYRGEDLTLTRERLIKTIQDAKAAGFQVLLNPQLWIGVHWGVGEWRGFVRMDSDESWQEWFAQYREFIRYFAEIAQETEVSLFCVGSELEGTVSGHETEWREIIAVVRSIYHGPCTYSANWGEEWEQVPFWDLLEYAGISAYYPVGDGDKAARMAHLLPVVERLRGFHERTGKPILFLESGFQSRPGSGVSPSEWKWNADEPVDVEEQRLNYEVWFETFWPQPWFYGVYWWQWFADPEYDAGQQSGYAFRNKPAMQLVRDWFTRPSPR